MATTLVDSFIGVEWCFEELDWLVSMGGFLCDCDFDLAFEYPFVEQFFNRQGLVFCMR